MIIMELRCPKCGRLKLFHSQDFEDSSYCICGYSHEAWQFPHRPILAIDNNYHTTDMTDLKWQGKQEYTSPHEYPYFNDTLELSYKRFTKVHKEWRKFP
jgi:hypothetical protein